jgi:hypothetical protein
MDIVLEAINALVPRVEPSPYTKRWWTKDLTHLRRIYNYYRNQARTLQRQGNEDYRLERRAKEFAKEYHDAIRR